MARLLRYAFLLVVVLVGVANADEDPTARARQLFDSGRRHFDLAEYNAALDDFKEGYRLKDDPVFLYNIALCHRLLDHKIEALRFFKSYLNRSPNAPNRAEIEKRVAALEEELASENKARAVAQAERPPPPSDVVPSPAPVAAETPKPPLYRRWWLWTAVAGVVVVGVGVGLGVGLTQDSGTGRYAFPRVQF